MKPYTYVDTACGNRIDAILRLSTTNPDCPTALARHNG
jgi:predicted nucleic acid-binding Zn ribbon protein